MRTNTVPRHDVYLILAAKCPRAHIWLGSGVCQACLGEVLGGGRHLVVVRAGMEARLCGGEGDILGPAGAAGHLLLLQDLQADLVEVGGDCVVADGRRVDAHRPRLGLRRYQMNQHIQTTSNAHIFESGATACKELLVRRFGLHPNAGGQVVLARTWLAAALVHGV